MSCSPRGREESDATERLRFPLRTQGFASVTAFQPPKFTKRPRDHADFTGEKLKAQRGE